MAEIQHLGWKIEKRGIRKRKAGQTRACPALDPEIAGFES